MLFRLCNKHNFIHNKALLFGQNATMVRLSTACSPFRCHEWIIKTETKKHVLVGSWKLNLDVYIVDQDKQKLPKTCLIKIRFLIYLFMQSQRVFCNFVLQISEDEEKAGTESNSKFPSTEINISFYNSNRKSWEYYASVYTMSQKIVGWNSFSFCLAK